MTTAEHPRLDALTALLASAQELVRTLGAEPAVRRAFDALAQLQPDDRITLATAIERAVKWRRVNESVSEANGVRLVANPNPRLFVRVVDKAPPPQVSPDPDDVLVGIARLLHRAPVLACDAARAVWEPAAEEALAMISAEQRAACLDVARRAVALVERAIAANEDAGPVAHSPEAASSLPAHR